MHSNERRSFLKSFVDPATFPHLMLLVFASSSLYALMEIGFNGIVDFGSIIFLSFSISYVIAAILTPTNFGEKLFKIGLNEEKYWKSSLMAILPIIVIVTITSVSLIAQLDEDGERTVSLILASLFIIMSIGQGLSLSYGGVIMARRRSVVVRKGNTEKWKMVIRSGIAILIFLPIVWWYGYQAGSIDQARLSTHVKWIGFLLVIGMISIVSDSLTKSRRLKEGIDGRTADKLVFLLVLGASWHLVGAWRRFLSDGPTISMMLEEAVLMGITVILTVWSLSNKAFNKGWRIFRGRSAIFWGVAFGYAYGGSIACLSALSNGNFLDVTAGGHLLTAIIILAFSPIAVSIIGGPVEKLDSHSESTVSSDVMTEGEKSDGFAGMNTGAIIQDRPTQFLEESDQEDSVELVD